MKELEQRHLDAMRRLYEQKDQRKLLTPRELLERLRKK